VAHAGPKGVVGAAAAVSLCIFCKAGRKAIVQWQYLIGFGFLPPNSLHLGQPFRVRIC
jgi:hypothetical protein